MSSPAVYASSVDDRELDYYTKQADLWWDLSGPFWPLHRLNQLRVPFIESQISKWFDTGGVPGRPLTGLKVLDVGCGGGILSVSMAELGAKVHGIDVVERNISVASVHARRQGLAIDYEWFTAEALASQVEYYDVVLNMEVVEHVADLHGFMAACAQLVRPGGLMFVATINRTLLAFLVAIIGAEYVLRWMPKGTHRWSLFRQPDELRDLLRDKGLTIDQTSGVSVNPFTRSMHLTPFTGVNYMFSALKVG